MHKYRILTFDGGGVRGALTIKLLGRINKQTPEVLDGITLYAGTSTGSLIALGLAAGLSLAELEELYSVETCRYIFTPYSPGVIRPRYNIKRLKEVVEAVFPSGLRLIDLDSKVIIPAFKINKGENNDCWSPIFFSNISIPSYQGSADYQNMEVSEVALASCAAPVYFASYNNYIDGGVVANNPSIVALSFALAILAGRKSLPALRLFSLGTGFSANCLNLDTTYWGALQWLLTPKPPVPIISLLLDGNVRSDDMISSQLLGENYHRLNPRLPAEVGLDQYQEINSLKSFAENIDLADTINWLKRRW